MAADSDEIIHQQLRLKIMATLNALSSRDAIEFPRLRAIDNSTQIFNVLHKCPAACTSDSHAGSRLLSLEALFDGNIARVLQRR